MFGFFKSKQTDTQKTIRGLLANYVAHQQVLSHLSRAQSLLKLGRSEEAAATYAEAKALAQGYAKQGPTNTQAQLLYAVYLVESNSVAEALTFLTELLNRRDLRLSDDERTQVAAELHALRRRHPSMLGTQGNEQSFTQVYACQNCGRLHNFASLPCPHCGWYPENLEETACAIVLSNFQVSIPLLVSVSRKISNGRPAAEVVGNLHEIAAKYLQSAGHRETVEKMFSLLCDDDAKNGQRIEPLRQCSSCGTRILYSQADLCQSCNAGVELPDIVRLLMCVDNLLWLLEQRIEPSQTSEFAEFVCVLVAMGNDILRKQADPTVNQRMYALELLRKLKVLSDINQGAVVSLQEDDSLQIHVIKDRAREDSETYGIFIYQELLAFIKYMKAGLH